MGAKRSMVVVVVPLVFSSISIYLLLIIVGSFTLLSSFFFNPFRRGDNFSSRRCRLHSFIFLFYVTINFVSMFFKFKI